MLAAVPGVVGAKAAASWKFWLEGLWWSGLRLTESLDLWWDRLGLGGTEWWRMWKGPVPGSR